MSRYTSTKQITISLPCLNLGAIAQDIRATVTSKIHQARAAVQRKFTPVAHRLAVAGMACAVGVSFAIEVYRITMEG